MQEQFLSTVNQDIEFPLTEVQGNSWLVTNARFKGGAFQLSAYRMQHDRVLKQMRGHVVEFGFESENQTGIKALNALMERLQIAAALGKAKQARFVTLLEETVWHQGVPGVTESQKLLLNSNSFQDPTLVHRKSKLFGGGSARLLRIR